MNLSKSKYTLGVTCEKKMWLSTYKKEEAQDVGNDAVLENGTKVGELARSLFGSYVLIEHDDILQNMLDKTQEYLLNKPNIICEASFSYDDNFCSVDILKNDEDGVIIYEVKSSTETSSIYIDDIAYQTWVLKHCGLNVKKSCIVYINNEYVKHGALNINELFNIEDVSNLINLVDVENNVKRLKKVINDGEPKTDLSLSCHNPCDCPFFKYCTKHLPTPNIFDIGWRLDFNKKIEMYKRNIVTYEDVIKDGYIKDKPMMQIMSFINDSEPIINKVAIKSLLDSFTFPLYFLDFESFQASVPTIDGTRPYQQICFQYSLHILINENGDLMHKAFLSDDYYGNPMYGLCKKLCDDIPMNSCIIVYNQSFEKTRLKEMALLFPEFSEHLLNIRDCIVDLMVPFFNQDYYDKNMGGSYSIKVVLPALFPNDSTLDYHNLEQVHKGDEASNAFLMLPNLPKDEQEVLRMNMLKYCKLDTYAMVKIYEKLNDIIK